MSRQPRSTTEMIQHDLDRARRIDMAIDVIIRIGLMAATLILIYICLKVRLS